ncbi:MAG TPA: MlaD family protein [Pseudonocardiaceae bacterium]|jgi:phospholipid/cholesterol/gamma-HCH transport system substrate-binding protein|nr:MlaD family protein [Pseudonocardiaceae bacterium]
MLTRRMRVQLVVFVLIAVAGITYAGGKYAGLGTLFGIHGYVVTVQLADSGGIFSNAEVDYRGVPVGRVGALNLTADGVDAELDMDSSAPPIPASAHALVADRSAIGEQYIDLEPPNDQGPMLTDGSVIPVGHTSLPIAPQTLLTDLDQLATSVPTGSLQTVVNELDTAFSGTGPALHTLLSAAGSFTTTASQQVPQTVGLLASGRTVLDTQIAEANQITSFSTNLNLLAAQLQRSDPDIRRLIGVLPQVADQVDAVLRASGSDLGVVLANLLTTARITSSRTSALEQLLVEFPVATASAPSADPDGTGHLGFVLDFFDPMPCTTGYQGTVERPGSDVTPRPANEQAYCALPPSTGVDVRGANNAPFGGMPQVATAGTEPTPTPVGSGADATTSLTQLLGIG